MDPAIVEQAVGKWATCADDAEAAVVGRDFRAFRNALRTGRRQFQILSLALQAELPLLADPEIRSSLRCTSRRWREVNARLSMWKSAVAKQLGTKQKVRRQDQVLTRHYRTPKTMTGQNLRVKAR